MSEPAVRAELQITLKDGATAGIKNIEQQAEKAAKKLAAASEGAEKRTETSNTKQRTSYERLSHAREVLGVRSENSIQREIQQTEAAYKRLESSGTMSQDALARAAEKTHEKIARLTNEMGKLTREQKQAADAAAHYEKVQSRIRTGVSVAAGVAAAGYTLSRPAREAMSFDERLANMANTAYAERDAAGRKIGMKELEAVINKATRPDVGGGTREQAADSLDAMIAMNTLGYQRSIDFLPTVMRTASGSGADPTQIANLSSVLVGQGVVSSDAELKKALNMITAAGQAGGFEIKNMATWLSQQLPLAGKSGLKGLDGLQQVLTMNQAAMLTAGSADEAGNNVKNLLSKLTSKDTATDFDKAGRGDLTSYMMNQRLKGVDAVTAWQNIIDKEAESDPRLKAALQRLSQTKDKGEQAQIIESIKSLAEGGVIGKYFQDMQAVGALMGLRNRGVVDNVNSAITRNRTEYGVNDVNYEVMSSTAAFQTRATGQSVDAAKKSVIDEFTPAISSAAKAATDLATKHPFLTGSAVLATTALTALAGAAGLASMTMGGGKGGAIANAAMKYGPTASKFGRALGGLAGAGAVYEASYEYVGTPLKHGIDGLVQWGSGDKSATLGTWIYDLLHSDTLKQPESAKMKADVNVSVTDDRVVVKRTNLETSGVDATMNTGSIWGTP